MSSAVVEASRISKSYQDGNSLVRVLRGVSFSLHAGASMAVTGPSGSGKSTLLNLLAGTLVPDDGTIFLATAEGRIAWHAAGERQRTRVRRAHIGYVHQFFNLIPTLTVLENVRLPGRLNHTRSFDGRALALLEQFHLGERLRVFPEVLSGGEQQRVAVARALLLSPPLLLADEPTGNLDRDNSDQVADLLFSAAAESGSALLIATHSDAVARRAGAQLRSEN